VIVNVTTASLTGVPSAALAVAVTLCAAPAAVVASAGESASDAGGGGGAAAGPTATRSVTGLPNSSVMKSGAGRRVSEKAAKPPGGAYTARSNMIVTDS
jgi:hypothetical protein